MTVEDKEIEDLRLQRKRERRAELIGIALLPVGIPLVIAFMALSHGLAASAILFFGFLLFYLIAFVFGVWPTMLLVYVTGFAYKKIRRLGYFPTSAMMLVLSALIASVVLILIVTVVLLPRPNSDSSFWEKSGEILICIALTIVFVPFGFTVLVRTLPKRNPRVVGHRRSRFPFVSLGYLIIIGSIAGVAALMISYPEKNTFWGIRNLFYLLVLVNFLVSLPLIITGKKLRNQVTIEDAIKSDARLLVLYLRPFAADEWPFVRWEDAESKVHTNTFEEYLSDAFGNRIGPFVALGNPEDYLPREGAIRTYADDEGWYEYFERLARRAGCIVILASSGTGLQQELTFIRREGLQRRLFILTAIVEEPRRAAVRFIQTFVNKPIFWMVSRLYGPLQIDERATWEQLAQNVGTGFEFGDDPGRGAVVTFDSEGQAKVLVKGADTPSKFVEPIREYLVTTLGLDLGDIAAKPERDRMVALASENGAPSPG